LAGVDPRGTVFTGVIDPDHLLDGLDPVAGQAAYGRGSYRIGTCRIDFDGAPAVARCFVISHRLAPPIVVDNNAL